MVKVITYTRESSIGPWARRMRMTLHMTQQELADMCGVSKEDVDSFEHNLPVRLDTKSKLLKQLRAERSTLCQTFPR